jgi:hypothetical protein
MEYPLPGVQKSFASCQLVEIPCFTSLPRDDLTPLDFRVDKTDHCIDPTNMYLYLRCSILKSKGDEEVMVYPANNLAYTMWQNVEMFISDQKITLDQTLYPWMSYVICLTQFSSNYRNTAMQTGLWFKDSLGTMDTATGDNIGAVERRNRTLSTFELYSKVITDFVQLPRLLPKQTELMLRFIPANPLLYLVAEKGSYKMKIHDAKVYVSKVHLTVSIPRKPTYPASRFNGRSRTVNVGEQNLDWTPFTGVCPRRVYILQILQKTYNGQMDKNPFNLQTFGVRRIQCFVNELSLPVNAPLTVGDSDVVRCFSNTVNAVASSESWDISLDAYTKGFFLYVIDLTRDHNANGEYFDTPSQGSVRIVIDYHKPMVDAVTVICFAETDAVLSLDEYRNPVWS